MSTRAARPARWRYRRSLANRVIWLTTVAVGLAVAFVAAGAYLTARVQMEATLDQSLLSRARQAAASPALARITAAAPVSSAALGAGDVRIGFLYADGGDVTTYTNDYGPPLLLGTSPPEVAVAEGDRGSSIRTVEDRAGESLRVVAVPAPEDATALLIAQSLSSQERVLAKLGFVMLLFGAVGVAVAGAAGYAVARNGLRPVRNLTTSVETVARTEDLTPLVVEGDDEIARLGGAFNQVLAALGASRDRQRRLVADAGHELRTPLTSLRTNLELLRQAEDGDVDIAPESRRELLDDVGAQIEELTTLIGDLVQLARDEGAEAADEPVDLAGLVERAAARVRLRAPGVRVEVGAHPWWVVGDGAVLERAVTNLLDNAAKWSPHRGTVTARLLDGVLVVDDEGPGIKEADRPHVFERFWRAEESRALPGSGLGLSIVQQAADRHAGTVEALASPAGGARLVLRLPGSPTPPADLAAASVSAVG